MLHDSSPWSWDMIPCNACDVEDKNRVKLNCIDTDHGMYLHVLRNIINKEFLRFERFLREIGLSNSFAWVQCMVLTVPKKPVAKTEF